MGASLTPQEFWMHKILCSKIDESKIPEKTANFIDHPGTWWENPLNPDSLRLTRFAFNILKRNPAWKFQKFVLNKTILAKTFLQLEKHCTGPFFIQTHNTIWLSGETEILMVALHANDLQQYLDNQSNG